MRTLIISFLAFVSISSFGQLKGIEIGSDMPLAELKLENTDGNFYSLNDLQSKNGIVVVFSSNTCPFVKIWEKDYTDLYKRGKELGISFVLINSNEKNRETVDSKAEMLKIQKEFGYESIAYLIDVDSKLANAFDANTTPHIFMFDSNNKLVYRGSIDDRFENKGKVKKNDYLLPAMMQLASGEEISKPITRNYGCSIKRQTEKGKREKIKYEEKRR